MAEGKDSISGSSAPSLSMRMTTYGIGLKFPSVRNITCEQLEQWRSKDRRQNMICLVSINLFASIITLAHLVPQDTRPLEEFNVSHLPGAIRVDPGRQPSLDGMGIAPSSTGGQG